jgi:hypothetical protein
MSSRRRALTGDDDDEEDELNFLNDGTPYMGGCMPVLGTIIVARAAFSPHCRARCPPLSLVVF